jgi:hypothetical protein
LVLFRAMKQRLQRRLEADHQKICSPRGYADRTEKGNYFIVDTARNVVVAVKLTEEKLEAMARKLGALREWEEVER